MDQAAFHYHIFWTATGRTIMDCHIPPTRNWQPGWPLNLRACQSLSKTWSSYLRYSDTKLDYFCALNSTRGFCVVYQGLEGRSNNPVSLLFDSLFRPCADMGMDSDSLLHWQHHPDKYVDHVVLGKGPPGGSWQVKIRFFARQLCKYFILPTHYYKHTPFYFCKWNIESECW